MITVEQGVRKMETGPLVVSSKGTHIGPSGHVFVNVLSCRFAKALNLRLGTITSSTKEIDHPVNFWSQKKY